MSICWETDVVDELTYRSYRVQRDLFPEIKAGRWAQIFDHQAEMEARYQREILEMTNRIDAMVDLVDRCEPLQRLLENAVEPERCNECGSVLKLERFSSDSISESCPNCDEDDDSMTSQEHQHESLRRDWWQG